MIIANIQSLNEADRATVLGHFGQKATASAGPVKELEVKKHNANKGKATCWGDFAKKILSEKKDAVLAFKIANPETKGAHLLFMANYKKEHAEEFTAFKEEWAAKEETADDAASVASEPVAVAVPVHVAAPVAEKPKRVMTDEQKAKMKAGREAAKAKKAAEIDQTVAKIEATIEAEVIAAAAKKAALVAVSMAAEETASVTSGSTSSSGAKKRGPKKLADMTPEERAKHDSKKAERKAKKATEAVVEKPRSPSPKLKDE